MRQCSHYGNWPDNALKRRSIATCCQSVQLLLLSDFCITRLAEQVVGNGRKARSRGNELQVLEMAAQYGGWTRENQSSQQ